jgi:hypothetical protein
VGWRCSKVGPLLRPVKAAAFPEVRIAITSSTSLGTLCSLRLTLNHRSRSFISQLELAVQKVEPANDTLPPNNLPNR